MEERHDSVDSNHYEHTDRYRQICKCHRSKPELLSISAHNSKYWGQTEVMTYKKGRNKEDWGDDCFNRHGRLY